MSLLLSSLQRADQPRLEVVLVTTEVEREQMYRLRYDIYVTERQVLPETRP